MVKYQQIANDLRKKIATGEYEPGKQISLEKEMCEHYGVSRITVKRAVDELVNQGLIVKRRGSGTFVKSVEDRDMKALSMSRQLEGFTESYHGQKVTAKIIRFAIVHPTEKIAVKLLLKTEDLVYDIVRVRYAAADPIVIEYMNMPVKIIPGIKKSILKKSIYNYIQNDLKLNIQSAHRRICAVMPTDDEKKYLNIEGLLPLLQIEQVAFLDDGKPFEYSISKHRGDKIAFKTVSID
ncbi:GntR family transcriptional regulator [Pectinatus sottacetonis]|uniref:GntR family transcriptional regulator n=1 Tax=Pectinatus sottacetonis TaxID=1002795 RepID=UPI0018C60B99|nr:GntR family transcriptional regulator [Pectinatus sottacetonis]